MGWNRSIFVDIMPHTGERSNQIALDPSLIIVKSLQN